MAEQNNFNESSAGFLMSYEDSHDRVPVLWLHGFPLSNLLWDFQVDGLADIARLITPDLRGHGMTAPSEPPYTMPLFADDCARLLDHLEIDGPVVVAGLSMGGYIALEFARRFPERIAGLILAATRAGADSAEGRIGRDKAAGVAVAQGVQPIAADMLPKLMAPGTYEEQPDLVAFVKEMMLATSTDGVVGALAAMRDRPDSTPYLADIAVPTLVIHGQDDQLIPAVEACAMHEALPQSELVLVPAAGHLPNLERPDVFNDAVREFLARFYED